MFSFNNDCNIIVGDRMSSKTTLLMELSKIFIDKKSCFISVIDLFKKDKTKHIDFYFSLSEIEKTNDNLEKFFLSLKERLENNEYGYLFIDDAMELNSEIRDIIKTIKVTKFFTVKFDPYTHYSECFNAIHIGEIAVFKNGQVDGYEPAIFYGKHDNMSIEDFLLFIKRDTKINLIINE
jgi:hypothetical protein